MNEYRKIHTKAALCKPGDLLYTDAGRLYQLTGGSFVQRSLTILDAAETEAIRAYHAIKDTVAGVVMERLCPRCHMPLNWCVCEQLDLEETQAGFLAGTGRM